MRRPTQHAAMVAAVIAAAIALTGCGSDDESQAGPPASTSTPTPDSSAGSTQSATTKPPKPAPEGPTLELTVRGDIIRPPAERVKVERGEPVVFVIDSDRAGELHVHSSPEQSPKFAKGKTTISVTIDMPGVVEVEEHESGALVAQLEVR